jgi:indolepyruvate ferredoxin oxidoreductase, beta subunit
MKYDILIAGVGGQGTVLASRLLAASSMDAGFFTRTSETIGMSQRGGSVVSHVRIDSKPLSPIIPTGSVDLLIGFELAEAARNLNKLSPNGKCIVNTQVIKPVTVSLGGALYNTDEISEYIKAMVPDAVFVDGYTLAENAGSIKAVNVVLLGASVATGYLPFSKEKVMEIITKNVPKKFLDINLEAFNTGYEFINKTKL